MSDNFVAECLASKWDTRSGIQPNIAEAIARADKKSRKSIYNLIKESEVALKKTLRIAQHFSVGDLSELTLFEQLDSPKNLLRLPFPVMSISYSSGETKVIAVFTDMKEIDARFIWAFTSIRKYGNSKWECPTYHMSIYPVEKGGEVQYLGTSQYRKELKPLLKHSFTEDELTQLEEQSGQVHGSDLAALEGLVYALNSEEYETKIHTPDYSQAPRVRNRQQKKLLPQIEYRELVIKGKAEHSAVNSFDCLPCRPKREHMRRGHERHLKSGKIVWVRNCKVGSGRLGKIIKDYTVKGH
jgi:hypothetical protein